MYDLGGGTFDVSIIEIADVDGEKQFEVLSTNGDTFLGGEALTSTSIDFIILWSSRRNKALTCPERAGSATPEAAEKVNRTVNGTVDVNLPYITADATGPKHLNVKLTRAKLESLVEELIERTIAPCRTAIKDAGVNVADIQDVILVGGMTRMPKVQRRLKSSCRKPART